MKILKPFFSQRGLYMLFFCVSIGMISCSPEYVPNMVNTPMFDEKGELQANLSGGVSGTDAQLSYAISDHLGLMANGSFRNETSDTSNEFHKHHLYEFGIGYFDHIGHVGRYEIFGGLGTGRMSGYDESWVDDPVGEARFFKIFVQPSVGLKSKVIDGNFATRWVLVQTDYSEGNVSGSSTFQPFFEPVLTGRVGFKYVKITSQLGFSLPVGDKIPFDYQPFIFSLGLHLNINILGN